MSHRWLLSLLCLSLLSLSLVHSARARGELRVNEGLTRIFLERDPVEVLLAVENVSGESTSAIIKLELLDPQDTVKAQSITLRTIANGSQTFTIPLPLSKLTQNEQRQLLWYRLRYRLIQEGSLGHTIAEGIVSLSELTPELFEVHVVTSGMVREGGRYRVRVQTTHPITRRPVADVRVDGELTLENNDQPVKLSASKNTDREGYALLEFDLPPRFPQYPHSIEPAGGSIRITAKKGGMVIDAEDDVLVDQFARVLITSDKPLYQPGQAMHIRALVFTPSKRALANHNILIKVTDPEDLTVFRAVVKSSRFGVANADWPIPENTRLGNYRVWVGVEGDDDDSYSSYDVRISRYDLPNFTVNVESDRNYYLPGQNAEVKVRADYLFGKPVTRGHVRIVSETEREWNYREQKWDIEEGEVYEGETDANGMFVVQINLADVHKSLSGSGYRRFEDVTYAAYFTDPTTNRTEQRRFDLRITKEAVHVYLVNSSYDREQSRTLPFTIYVSTFYADGSPATCNVTVRVADEESTDPQGQSDKTPLVTFRTNRYGLAKGSVVLLPEWDDEDELDLIVTAVDSAGRSGSESQDFSLVDDEVVVVQTDKSLYRRGEPVKAQIISSNPDETLTVDVARESNVIRSERVQLNQGRASITFPYSPDFKDKLTIAAYGSFWKSNRSVATRTIIYPRDPSLKINLRTSQASYRPGQDAQVDIDVHAPRGRSLESALGVVVLDKAVEERFRTDQESGQRFVSLNQTLQRFTGLDEQIAGVTLRDLQRLDLSKRISPDLDLLAEVLLNRTVEYVPQFLGGNEYVTEQASVFGALIKENLKPLKDALTMRYVRTAQYPANAAALRRLLLESQIDLTSFRDPWGTIFRTHFSVEGQNEVLTLVSAGADKRFDTNDDFSSERLSWPYFRPLGEAIDRAVNRYHDRTSDFIRDLPTLREELSKDSLDLNLTRDRWGQPYQFDFEVDASAYAIKIRSGGPDQKFSTDKYYPVDDFVIWTSSIDYFAFHRTGIEAALSQNLKVGKEFPQTEDQLREALKDSPHALEPLRDPWNRPYYVTFRTTSNYADRVRLESRANLNERPITRTKITPVTRTLAFITMRSMGTDGQAGTVDDFTVATFSSVISEQARGDSGPNSVISEVVFQGNSGSIIGVVTDSNGASIPGVSVTATGTRGGLTYRTSTNDEGKYGFANLPSGFYEVRFEAAAFMPSVVTNVLVRPSSFTEVNAELQVGTVSEVVTVAAESVSSLNMTATNMTTMSVTSTRSSKHITVVTKSGGPEQISTPRLREYFPETLVWQPSIETDKRGRARINFKLADNITTWKLAVVGSTEDGQIGFTETEIQSFQPFFVDHDPPRVLTEGDEISLPVVVRNYLEQSQKVDLEIKPESWFSLLGPARKKTDVPSGDATRATFDFRATSSVKDGKQRITAISADANDAIEKPITVHPDGEEVSVTAGDILGSSASLEVNIPETMIPNSGQAELKIYPNLLAHVVESVEGIMARPYGCGEQTISSTYPSLLLLRYQKLNGGDFPLHARAQRYLEQGYNRLLNYRDESGGFTYWGRGEPDIALTAYALRFLTDAAEVMSIEEKVIQKARDWLIRQQQPNGGWGRQDHSIHGQRQNAVLTAFVTRMLAKTDAKVNGEVSKETSEPNKRALAYLSKQAQAMDEPYLLASYALAAIDTGDTARARPLVDKLRTLAIAEGNTTYWSLETNTPFYGWGLAGRVETTALVLQALTGLCYLQGANCELSVESSSLIKRGLLFLLKQKDRYGVWYSTQATINVLDAMLALLSVGSTMQSDSETHLAADVLINGRAVQTVQIPVAKSFVNPVTLDLSRFLSVGNNRVEIKRLRGGPFASVQVITNCYVPWMVEENVEQQSGSLRLLVKFNKTVGEINDEITCQVRAERVGFRGYGMMLAEIGLPPGADVDRSSLEMAMKSSGWAIAQYDVLPDRVVIYLWPQAGGVNFDFKFRPRLAMTARTSPSAVYDYYNPESRATVTPVTFRVK